MSNEDVTEGGGRKAPPGGSRSWALIVAVGVVLGLVAAVLAITEFLAERVPDPVSVECGTLAEGTRVTAAWGPERETFTMQEPAPYATMNNITNNPSYGDERTFFDVKDHRFNEMGGFCDSLEVHDGDVLLLRFYVENSAASNLVDAAGNGPGLADQVTVSVVPDFGPGSLQTITAHVRSSTTSPAEVFDSVELVAPYPIRLDYVVGSSILYTNARPKGIPLEDVWRRQVLLGYEDLDGRILPDMEHSMLGTLEVRITRVTDDRV